MNKTILFSLAFWAIQLHGWAQQIFTASESNIMLIEEFAFVENDSLFMQRMQDDFTQDPSLGFQNTKVTVHYAPDSLFKVFVLEAQLCEVQCQTLYYSLLQTLDPFYRNTYEVDFRQIQDIVFLNRHGARRYLVIDEARGRLRLMEGSQSLAAHVVSVHRGKVQLENLINFDEHAFHEEASTWCAGFTFQTSHWINAGTYLHYDPNSQQLSFRFQQYDEATFWESDAYLDIQGYLEWDGRAFWGKEICVEERRLGGAF